MQNSRCMHNHNAWLSLLSHSASEYKTDDDIVSKKARLLTRDDHDSSVEYCALKSPSSPETVAMPTSIFTNIHDALVWAGQGRDPRLPSNGSGGSPLPAEMKEAVHVQVLCTGSLHLVGGVLALFDPNLEQSTK